ncbi:UGT80B1, partial [Symbiodinium microadriaticum]
GWNELAEFARSSVCFVADVPHTWLLPHCSCLVHHGGAGTVQTALRAEVPSVVTPIFVDQFDNARAVSRLRAGVGFEEPLSKVSASQLAEAIAAAELQQPEAARLGEGLRSSGGSKEAAAQLDAFLRGEVSEGHFARQAADQYLHGSLLQGLRTRKPSPEAQCSCQLSCKWELWPVW